MSLGRAIIGRSGFEFDFNRFNKKSQRDPYYYVLHNYGGRGCSRAVCDMGGKGTTSYPIVLQRRVLFCSVFDRYFDDEFRTNVREKERERSLAFPHLFLPPPLLSSRSALRINTGSDLPPFSAPRPLIKNQSRSEERTRNCPPLRLPARLPAWLARHKRVAKITSCELMRALWAADYALRATEFASGAKRVADL